MTSSPSDSSFIRTAATPNNKGCCEWVSDSSPIRLRRLVEQARSDVGVALCALQYNFPDKKKRELPAPWTIFKPIKFPHILIYRLARQHEHPIKCSMNEIAKIRTSGSGFTLIIDRSVNTPQTRPVVQ